MKSMVVGSDLIFAVEHRGGDDSGPSLHVMVRLPSDPPRRQTRQFVQVWRADCFKMKPHEHLFGPESERITDLPPTTVEESVEWCLSQLKNLRNIVRQAGYMKIPASLSEPFLTSDAFSTLLEWMLEE